MAAGRGQFFRSFLEGLEKTPARTAPTKQQQNYGIERPGVGGRFKSPESGKNGGRRKKKKREKAQRSPASGTEPSHPEPVTDSPQMKCNENLLERLPSEILVKILSYLDAPSLFCISHVSKLLYQLADDDVMWQKIYLSEFREWTPSSVDNVVAKEDPVKEQDPVEVEDPSARRWKKMYFRAMAGHEMKMWRKELRVISPYTGLPRQTEWFLRNLNVSWELILCYRSGQRSTLEQSRAYFFETSVIIRWSGGSFLRYKRVSSIQLYGVRKESPRSPKARKSPWRSLMLQLETKTQKHRLIGKDGLIKVLLLPAGIIVGLWRGQNTVAFIMVSLHFHRLVEKSLLGSPVCPYAELVDLPPVDDSDPTLGLQGYSLHFVLHNTGTEIMSGQFRQLSCRGVQMRRGLVELRVIPRTNLSQHRSLSGSIRLPWKSGELEGAIENCCVMTLTLLDEFQKPFWCVSSPVCITPARKTLSWDYTGKHFLMEYQDPDGEVKMMLVWLEEQKQFFLIGLSVYVALANINERFGREY